MIPRNHHELDGGGCGLGWDGMGWDGMGWDGRDAPACLPRGAPEKRGDRIEHRTLNRIRQPLVSDESHLLRTIVPENLALFKKSDLSSFPPVLFSRLHATFAVDFLHHSRSGIAGPKETALVFCPQNSGVCRLIRNADVSALMENSFR
jgi:hypothetical protein